MQDASFRINTPIPYAVPLNIGKDGKEREFGRASENAVRREEAAAAEPAEAFFLWISRLLPVKTGFAFVFQG